MMSVLWNRKTVAQAWAQRSLPSSLAHVTWIDFTVGFSAFLLVAVYEYYRRSQPQTLVVEQEIPEPTVDMLCLREAFRDNSNVTGMQQQINKCINEIASLANLSPESSLTTATSLLPSPGHKVAFVVLCTLQLSLCLYTAFFLSKRRGTIKDLHYDVKDVTESVEEAYYLINELNSRVAQSTKEQPQSPTGVLDKHKEQLVANVLSKMEDKLTHPIEAIKTRLTALENNLASLQRANSNFNPRAPPYRGGGKLTRDPRGNENYRHGNGGGDFRSFDSRNDSRFNESNYSLDSRPWKPWNRTGGRSYANSTPTSAPIEFYGEKRSFEKMEWADKHNVASPVVTSVVEPTAEVIQPVARPVSAVPVPTTITGAPSPATQSVPKLVVNCTPQQSKKIIIKAGDREYDLASAEGREQWSSVAKRNIAKAITLPSHVQVQDIAPPPLAPLRTANTRPHTIELSPLTSTYSSETDGTEASKASKPKEGGVTQEERRAGGLDNYIESVGSPQSPNASLSRGLQLKLEENVSKKESSGSIGDASNGGVGGVGGVSGDGEKKPYRRLFIPGRGWVSARRIAMEKAQEQGGEITGCDRRDLGASASDTDVQPPVGENTAVAA
ncbi:hypothetical protein BKA91DRAFT_160581 [Yarrowia lipolytica]|nr:hypothetical protein BKA91DRAFT_160581 [Yarrowia lipolytica]RMI96024.1 hypothetical protein BD777DRAFT_160467 [Yarrowia lipolytica]